MSNTLDLDDPLFPNTHFHDQAVFDFEIARWIRDRIFLTEYDRYVLLS